MAVVNPSYRTIKEKLESIILKVINENLVSSWSSTTNNSRYPSEKLVKDSLDEKANVIDFYYDQNTDELVVQTASNVTDWSDIKDYIDNYMGNIIDYIEG